MIMLRLMVALVLIVSGNSLPNTIQTRLSCQRPASHNEQQISAAPYSMSIKQGQDGDYLITISATGTLPISGFVLDTLIDTRYYTQSVLQLLDEDGALLDHCILEKPRNKVTVLWKLQGHNGGNDLSLEASVWSNDLEYWSGISATYKKAIPVLPPNPDCGTKIGCFTNCTGLECDYIVSWLQMTNDTVNFKIQTKITTGTSSNTWAAIGLSSNQSMPGSSIIMCLTRSGKMSGQLGYTIGHTFEPLVTVPGVFTYIYGSVQGNVLECEVQRKIMSDEAKVFDLSKHWYLLFARGNVSNGYPIHHDFRVASDKMYNFKGPFEVKDFIKPDPWCGKAKGCFSNCTTKECEYMVSWTHDAEFVTYDIQTKVAPGTGYNAWTAIGLSFNQEMDGSSIMMCISDFGLMRTELGFTTDHTYQKIDDINTAMIFINGSTSGDILRCFFKRKIHSTDSRVFDLENVWYLLFAHGQLGKGFPQHHEFRIASATRFAFTAPLYSNQQMKPQVGILPPDDDCGKSKGCFTNCTDNDCSLIVSWTKDANHVTFYIQTKILAADTMNSYAAIGLSSNQSMPGSSIMMCLNVDGTMSAEYGYTIGHTYNKVDDTQHKLTLINSSVEDNIFRCAVQREINIVTDEIFSLRTTWFLLFARGNVTKGIPVHHNNRIASADKIDFLNVTPLVPSMLRYDYLEEPSDNSDAWDAGTTVLSDFSSRAECGVTKHCYHDCTVSGCSFLISWLANGDEMMFNMTAKVEPKTGDLAWIAVGLSPDGNMPRSSFMMCQNVHGQFYGEYGHSSEYQEFISIRDKNLTLIDSSVNGDVLQCSFSRFISSDDVHIFNLTREWHVLFAKGKMFYSSAANVRTPKYHYFSIGSKRAFSFVQPPETDKARQNTKSTVPPSSKAILPDNECGISKGCFSNCNTGTCTHLVTWSADNDDVTFTISADLSSGDVNSAWIGIGFSPDGQMPRSSFLLCLNNQGNFSSQFGHSPTYADYIPNTDLPAPVLTTSSVSGNVLKCTVKHPVISNHQNIYNLTQEWFILFAHGPLRLSNGQMVADYHSSNKFTGTNAVNFLSTGPIVPDNGCGVTKGCFDDCSAGLCTYLITWLSNDPDYVTFTISAKIDSNIQTSWIGIGLSPDGKMPRSSFSLCMNNQGNISSEYGHSTQYEEYVAITDIPGPTIESSSAGGNIFRCSIKHPVLSSHSNVFNLTEKWHILFAHGKVTVNQGKPTPNYHDFKVGGTNLIDFLNVTSGPTTPAPDTTSPQTTTATAPPSGSITLDAECGKTKGCFSRCSGASCTSLLTWQKDDDSIKFEIEEQVSLSPENRWVAIGFSSDVNMGSTSVIMCKHTSSGDSFILGYNDGLSFSPLAPTTDSLISDTSLTVTGDIMRCNLRRKINSTDPKVFDLSQEWYILMGNGPISGGTPVKHEKTPIASTSKLNLQAFSSVQGGIQTSTVIKVHGCLMITAWIFFSSIGIILARFFKKQWADSSWMNQKIWFQIHRTSMVLVVLISIAGFILILVENGGYREITEMGELSYVNYHPIFGIIVVCLAVLNPIIALFRCAPTDDRRPIFNWVHSIIGTSAHIFGAITVAFGLHIPKAAVDVSVNYVIIIYAVAFVAVEFLLTRLSQQDNTPKRKEKDFVNLDGIANGSKEKQYNLSGSQESLSGESSAMKFVLFLHFLLMISTCITMVYFVINAGETT